MEIKNNDACEMTFENRYKVFSIENRVKYADKLYEPYKVRELPKVALKNRPKHQSLDDRKEGYIFSFGIDEKGYYEILLPTENEYEKIKAFAKIKDKIAKLSKLANLQRQLTKRRKTLAELESIEKEIDELYIDVFEEKTKSIPFEIDIKKTEILKNKNESNLHNNIFSNNGFELFSYILENHIAKNRGRYADVSYYYWRMYGHTPQFIHQRPESFKNWFCQTYQEDFEKIKTLNEVTDQKGNRNKHYSTSLDWFNNQS